jgi:hypothetical protein
MVEGVDVYGAGSLSEVVQFLRGEISLEPVRSTNDWSEAKFGNQDLGFGEVRGQQHGKRPVEVAAAGGHNILTIGPIPPKHRIQARIGSKRKMEKSSFSRTQAHPRRRSPRTASASAYRPALCNGDKPS